MRWVILAVVVLAVLVAIATGEPTTPSPEASAKARARAGIEACWQDYARKSLAPEQKRFIAGACEQAEQNFRSKYGTAP